MADRTLPPARRWARPKEAAAHLRVSRATLWAWCKERADFPKPQRIGPNAVVFDLGELDAFVARQGAAQR